MPAEDKPHEVEWEILEELPHIKAKGNVWERTFLCCCGAELTFSGVDSKRRGMMHMRRFHKDCGGKEEGG